MTTALLALALAVGLPTVPGADNPAVTQANIATTICKPGWSGTVRPPTTYTQPIKFALMDAAGIPRSMSRRYELDHDVSIEDAGSPTSRDNLWLEPYFGPWNAHDKDRVENALHKDVCTGKMTLAADRAALHANWEAEYERRWGVPPDAKQ